MMILPLLCAVLFQDPQVPIPAATPADQVAAPAAAVGAHLDQVELVGGEVLEGRIVLQRANYLEIELGPGAVVGFRTTNVVAIRPGAGAPVAAVVAPLPQRDEWFALHDGSGKAVGWLHSTATPAIDGGVALQEEWEFASEHRQFQVTCLETVGADLQPRSCYFRERIREQQPGADPTDPLAVRDRTGQERIVEARVDGDVLVVARLTADGRRERRLPWPAGATFPLLARQLAAAGASGEPAEAAAPAGERDFTVFDAATEEMQVCRVEAPRWRTVPIEGVAVRVAETIERCRVANTIWRDADAHVVRREIAGPALVAVPCLAAQAHTAASARTAVAAPFVAEPGHRFGLWRPNPVWQVLPPRPGSVALHSELNHASIALSALPEGGQDLTLDAAAEAALRWWSLLNPEFTVDRRDWVRVRDRLSARIEFTGGLGAERQRTVLHVVPADVGFVVLRCSAPVARWNELQADFDAAVAHLELVPGVVAAQEPPDQDRDKANGGDNAVADVARAAGSTPGADRTAADGTAAAATPAAAAVPLPHGGVRVKVPSEQPFLRDGK